MKLALALDTLHEAGGISHTDYYFAKTMAGIFPADHELAAVSCALVSRALGQGHICLNLAEAAGTCLCFGEQEAGGTELPSFPEWMAALASAGMVAKISAGHDPARFPLVLDADNLLYLSKYYDFQSRLVENLFGRLYSRLAATDPERVRQQVARVFHGQDPVHTRGQQEAVEKALLNRFTLISGGPGTGKTHITRIIKQLLTDGAVENGSSPPRFVAVAPTGKAASRLDQGTTIHSLLKPLGNGPGFRHNRDNPIAADVVIIDEASMIDLALMTRLLEAIPGSARVILLGDENQLSPVQAGAVFNDICRTTALAPFRVSLDYNFRSGGKTGIENLSRAIIHNDDDALTGILTGGSYPDLRFEDTKQLPGRQNRIRAIIRDGFQGLAGTTDMAGALEELDRFRILCAHNNGESGTLQINHLCEKILRPFPDSGITERFFKRIIMIDVNDYDRGLFNGDTGVVMETGGGGTAGFRMADGVVRTYRPLDLPPHGPAFAVTIHKSQGSEFETVLILIPDRLSPVVTRQLLYTGVTRARKKAVILGSLENIRAAMGVTTDYASNLPRLLTKRLSQTPNERMDT